MASPVLGFIGGSGLYDWDFIDDAEWIDVSTPWGRPSDQILTGSIDGNSVVFLPRHGRHHSLSPNTVPYRANIDALKQLGVTDLISVSACGSFREEYEPGSFVIVDQYIDRTTSRAKSFFGNGCVGHVSMASPVCTRLADLCHETARDAGIAVHSGGTYLAMEGPQFSTIAESSLYRNVWKCDVIGMTNMPEAKLAREAEICYATVAMVTDYDSWHPDHGEVDIVSILNVLSGNARKAGTLTRQMPGILASRAFPCPHGCDRALEYAIITRPEARDPELLTKLQTVAGRVLNSSG